jgi:hypothetical protein
LWRKRSDAPKGGGAGLMDGWIYGLMGWDGKPADGQFTEFTLFTFFKDANF